MFELYQAQENQAPIALEDVRLRLYDSIKKVPGNDFGNQLQRPLKDIGISYSRVRSLALFSFLVNLCFHSDIIKNEKQKTKKRLCCWRHASPTQSGSSGTSTSSTCL